MRIERLETRMLRLQVEAWIRSLHEKELEERLRAMTEVMTNEH